MSSLTQYLCWLDNQQPAMQDLLRELCDINSGTFNVDGVNRVVDRLDTEFSEIGDVAEQLPVSPMRTIDNDGLVSHRPLGNALRVVHNEDAARQVLLCIHTDTVYSADHPFQTCEEVSGNRLRGPGVADAKGGIVVMLFALRCLQASPLARKIGWEVLLNPDEEIGSPGSLSLLKDCAQRNDFGLLFEPAYPDGSMVACRKGSGNFIFVVTGQAAHAGRDFDKGRNAIVRAARIVDQISLLNENEFGITYNVGKITGGGPLNIVPDLAIVRVNVRIGDFPHIKIVEKAFDRLVDQTNQLNGYGCELHGSFSSPPKLLDDSTQAIQKQIDTSAAELQIATRWVNTGGASDGNKLFAAGLPNIDTMGVVGGNIHSDQEYVLLDSLMPRAKLTALMLMKHASGEFKNVSENGR